MKTTKILTAIIAITALSLMTSCLKSGNSSMKVTSNLPGLFNAVIDLQTGETTLYDKQSIVVEWEQISGTADLKINGLKLPNGASYPMLEFNNLKWGTNYKGWMDISFSDRKPDSSSGYVSDLVFTKFQLQTVNISYNDIMLPPFVDIAYTIDNKYQIYALSTENVLIGTTTVTDANGTVWVQPDNKRAIYYMMFDAATKKGFVLIEGAQFAEGMPGLNMKFPGIPFDVNQAGRIEMAAETIEPALMGDSKDPYSAGTPAPNYPITNLRGQYNPGYGVTLAFDCTPTGKNGVEMGKYHVEFTTEFPKASTSMSTTK